MDGFARQLADLRRAASRAGRDGGGGRGGGGGGRDDRDRDRKRGRYDNSGRGRRDDNGHNGRRDDYDRGRGGGRRFGGGGRNRPSRENEQHRRSEEAPLAALVETAAQKYRASQQQKSAAAGDGGAAGGTRKKKRRRHVALLFLTIDDLPHEHVWREWLATGGQKSNKDGGAADSKIDGGGPASNEDDVLVSVVCHAKCPERIESPWLRRRHLLERRSSDNCHRTSGKETGGGGGTDPKFRTHRPGWGSIEITRAMIDLLEEGLRIGADGDGEGRSADRRYLSTPGDAPDDDEANAATAEDAKPSASEANAKTEGDGDDGIPPVDRFVFVSESCLPVATLRETELALFGPRPPRTADGGSGNDRNGKDADNAASNSPNVEALYDKSWIRARSTPNNGYARQLQWDAIRPADVPPHFVWKADQWLVLTRAHASAVANLPRRCLDGRPLWPAFRKVRASDELYFPTALAILGCLRRPSNGGEVDETSTGESCAGSEVRRRKATYCDWSVGAKNPAAFTSKEWGKVVRKARGEGCLFARKFVPMAMLPGGNGKGDAGDGVVSVGEWRAAVVEGGKEK